MTQQVAETLVRYRVDNSSVGQAVAANEKLIASNKKVVASSSDGGGLRLSRADNTIGSGFGTVRSIAGAFGQAAGMGEVGGVIGAVAGLGVELGVVGLAAGATTLIFRALAEESARVTAETKTRLDAETKLEQQLAKATRQQALAAQAAAQDTLTTAQGRRAELQNAPITMDAGELVGGLLTQRFGRGEVEGYTQAIAEQDLEIVKAQAALAFWTEAIANNSTAVNTATQEQLAAADRALKIDQMTAEEREKQIALNERQISILTEMAESGTLTGDAFNELLGRIYDLRVQTDDLSAATSTYADQLAREEAAKKLVTTQYDNYLKALDTEIKIREEIADTIAKINEIVAERDEALAELAADRVEQRLELEAEYAERLQDIAQTSADNIARIMRDAGREQFAAVAERDALAFYQSQIKAADALDDQRLADKRQIEQLAKHLARQESQLDKSYAKQYDQLVKSSQKQIDVQNRALQQQQVDLQNAQYALQAIALTGSGGQVVIHTQMWQDLNNVAVTFAANTINSVRNILSSLFPSASGSGGGGGGGGGIGIYRSDNAFNRAFDRRLAETRGGI